MMRHLRLSTLVALLVVIPAVAAAAAPYAYITNSGSGSVSLIDLATNQVLPTTIAVGSSPFGVAMSKDGSRVYVSNLASGTVSVINTLTDPPSVIGAITTGSFPFGVAVSPDGTRLYVARSGNGTVGVYSTSDYKQVGSLIPVGSIPRGIAVSPDGRYVVASTGSGSTYAAVIDTLNSNSVDLISNGGFTSGGFGVAISPDGAKAYVVRQTLNAVAIIDLTTDPATELGVVAVGGAPIGVAINNDGTRMYVTNSSVDSVSVVDIGSAAPQVIAEIPVGDNPHGLSLGPAGDRLYVANRVNGGLPGTVSVVTLTTNPPSVDTLTVGNMPMSLGTFIHRPSSVDTLLSLTVSPNSVTLGSAGPVSFNAKLTRKDNNAGVGGASLAYMVDGSAVGSASTAADGTAAFSYNPSALGVGTHSVSVNFAGSVNGTVFNASSASGSFSVVYAFSGWLGPVTSGVNTVTAGQTVVVKWTLTDASGAMITDPGAVLSVKVGVMACGGNGPSEWSQANGTLRVNGEGYMFQWRTAASFNGTCMRMAVAFNDGTTRYANFKFR